MTSLTPLDSLLEAIKRQDWEQAQHWLDQGVDINEVGEDGSAALHVAENYGVPAMEWVLKHGADINLQDAHGWTVLHSVVLRDQLDRLAWVIGQKANLDIQDPTGITPLHLAVFRDNKEAFRLLMEAGAQDDIKDDEGLTPWAYWTDTDHGNTPLLFAAFHGWAEVVKRLLARGDDVNATNTSMKTPLHAAASQGHEDVVRMLLAAGADVNAQSNEGATALMWSIEKNNRRLTECLMEAGADIHIQNANGHTVMQLAQSHKWDQVVNGIQSQLARRERDDLQSVIIPGEDKPSKPKKL